MPSDILSNGAIFAQLSFEIAGTSTAGTTHKTAVTVNVGNGPGSVTPASQPITGKSYRTIYCERESGRLYGIRNVLLFGCGYRRSPSGLVGLQL